MDIESSQCLIIKIGSALLVDEKHQRISQDWLKSLVADVADLMQQGKRVVLVSSGAIALGRLATEFKLKTESLSTKQALAAVGQVQLMHLYQTLFKAHDINAAQVLITLEDTEDRGRFINLRNTLNELLAYGIIPIINENDSIATTEIRYGDNDRLAARVIQMVDADTLVLLSDIDGLHTDDPRLNPAAKLIPVVNTINNEVMKMAKNSSSNYGSGGMISKLDAAKISVSSGCNMLITAGKHLHPLKYFMQHKKGTWFEASLTPKKAKQTWLQQHLKPQGTIIIDDGAAQALIKGASLLAVGIIRVECHFSQGAAVEIVDKKNKVLARGLVNFPSNELHKIIGQRSSSLKETLGYETSNTVVHRDNMVRM